MKKIFLLAALISAIQTYAGNTAGHIAQEELLSGIQYSINNAFGTSMMSQDDTDLISIRSELETLQKKAPNNLILYWCAYTDYYLTILYLQINDREKAGRTAETGVNTLMGIQTKTSDDYALLSLLQGMLIQFSGMKAASVAVDMKKNASMAVDIDPENIRANYAYGIADFFTPEAYGGGKVAEKYFLKAISLPTQKIPGKYHPSWGKEESYEYLIRLYIKNGQTDKAMKYCEEGLKSYPTNYILRELKETLEK